MSLATALAHDGLRPASMLPTIKCSDCAKELEIAEMADHVCSAASSSPPPPSMSKGHSPDESNPFILRRVDSGDGRAQERPLSPRANAVGSFATRARPMMSPMSPTKSLPKINPDAANAFYAAPGRGTMNTPLSPSASNKFEHGTTSKPSLPRSLTSPAPRLYDPRPPSAELSANLDCAFPPFPTPATSARRPSTKSTGRKTPTDSGTASPRGASRLDQVLTIDSGPLDLEPKSPRLNGGENVLQRMRTLQSGPFNATRQDSDDTKDNQIRDETPQASMHTVEDSPNPPPAQHIPPPIATKARPEVDLKQTYSVAVFPTSPIEESFSPSYATHMSAEPTPLVPSKEENFNFETIHEESDTVSIEESSASAGRAELPGKVLPKMRSEPGLRSADMRATDMPPSSGPTFIPQSQIPPRKDSATANRFDYRIQDAPPVPKAVQEYRQEALHSPSDSGSSVASMTNSTSVSNFSSTSPVESVASSHEAFSPLSFESLNGSDEGKMRDGAARFKNSTQPGIRAEQSIHRSPSRKFIRPSRSQDGFQNAGPLLSPPLESPMDPLLQQRSAGSTQPQSLVPSALQIPRGTSESRGASLSPSPGIPGARSIPRENQQLKRSGTRRAGSNRATCRGCGQAIEGKSVKAADGRLTGRWHKECFVCRCCRAPFTTADFYVIDNEPYCEHHYHEKNGSLCSGCNHGIEGQYLETSSSTRFGSMDKKFHPRCFTCTTCRVVLAQDYFEITGRVFCERHALAAMRAQARSGPGLRPPDRRGLTAERRTTRLINPMMA